jgi:hypothetical protein
MYINISSPALAGPGNDSLAEHAQHEVQHEKRPDNDYGDEKYPVKLDANRVIGLKRVWNRVRFYV